MGIYLGTAVDSYEEYDVLFDGYSPMWEKFKSIRFTISGEMDRTETGVILRSWQYNLRLQPSAYTALLNLFKRVGTNNALYFRDIGLDGQQGDAYDPAQGSGVYFDSFGPMQPLEPTLTGTIIVPIVLTAVGSE